MGTLSHSLSTRLILWSADARRDRILLTSKFSIALAIHSFDPLECRREEESCSIDIALRWSENQTTKERFSRLVIERKMSVAC